MNYWTSPSILTTEGGKTLGDYEHIAIVNIVAMNVSKYYNYYVDRMDVLGKSRKRQIIEARRTSILFLASLGFSSVHVSKGLNLDHATSLHHLRRALDYIEYDSEYLMLVNKCKEEIQNAGFSFRTPNFGMQSHQFDVWKRIFKEETE